MSKEICICLFMKIFIYDGDLFNQKLTVKFDFTLFIRSKHVPGQLLVTGVTQQL